MFIRIEILPELVILRSNLMRDIFKPIFDKLGIKIKIKSTLPSLDRARAGMLQLMDRMFWD